MLEAVLSTQKHCYCDVIHYFYAFAFRFTKNMSPDKINVSTLRGEGELSNLELDERVLMELIDLPTWLRLTKAICNRVAIKVSTKLGHEGGGG